MPLNPSWQEILLRLLLTVVAGALVGLNREAHGKAAGFRTTILVGLAAAISMIQANLLLSVAGKTPESFATMDVLRFPLGVLTGVGFIGGGTILRKGDLVSGVTTAATLWVMTAIGLAFGGGQLWLGIAGTLLTLVTLLALKWVDLRIPRQHHATVALGTGGATAPDLAAILKAQGYEARFAGTDRLGRAGAQRFLFDVSWTRPEPSELPPGLLTTLAQYGEVEEIRISRESRD
ncbi:putative Mg2+ transporter-C (MgtC) family protein [Mesorhizobium soli]|uniref:MgtC/SapB family protein n=1 Tax=Pseudaminobacter soli (ex Li et al. 2025) TaxID=1295366 RepID=UPI0024737470|nr:MgtC/SapB family protein [Mesorhizobium soli]MDH6232122.1 putative Mg2+ transporter-C (MgtC) family protein [Mesorhizobium soli]